MSKGNTICWTDVPVNNLDRAIQFYSAVLGTPVIRQSMPGMEFGLLPHADENVSGCLVKTEDNQPSEHGPLVYLSVEGRLDDAIRAVLKGAGKVLKEKHPMGLAAPGAVLFSPAGLSVMASTRGSKRIFTRGS